MNDELIIKGVVAVSNGARREIELHIPLRPLFAAVAMNGLLSNSKVNVNKERGLNFGPEDTDCDAIAEASCLLADALLKRLDEKPQASEVAE